MKRFTSLLVLIVFFTTFSGCAAYTAMRQPSKKNLQVLSAGMSRDNVIAHLGSPATTDTKDGKRVEIYNFVQGYGGGVKASRAIFHVAADLFTLFIWELIGWPLEAVIDGTEMSVKVSYDQNDKVENVNYLKGKA